MPEILFHIAFGYILYKLVDYFLNFREKNIYLFLFLLGSLIPDIKIFVSWITYFISGNEDLTFFSMFVTHNIFGSFLISLFLSATLFRKIFLKSLTILTIGFFGHFFLDISQYPFAHVNHLLLLYPLSGEIFYINYGFFESFSIFEIFKYIIFIVAIVLLVYGQIKDRRKGMAKA